jgi:hypothetical protein
MTERELVRCGCGVVRSPDEDAVFPSLAVAFNGGRWSPAEVAPNEGMDWPRTCRGCGGVYQLPKPSAPKGETSDAE